MNTSRHYDTIKNVDMGRRIAIIGCGSIGTAAATTLTRLGYTKFTLYDEDVVEEHNIANQNFEEEDIGIEKTKALAIKMSLINKEVNIELQGRINNDSKGIAEIKSLRGAIIVVATDDMKSRSLIAHNYNAEESILVEARMGGNEGHVYSIRTLEALSTYIRKHLYGDEEATTEACTNKSIIYNINIIGSAIARHVLMQQKEETEEEEYTHTLIDTYNLTMETWQSK